MVLKKTQKKFKQFAGFGLGLTATSLVVGKLGGPAAAPIQSGLGTAASLGGLAFSTSVGLDVLKSTQKTFKGKKKEKKLF